MISGIIHTMWAPVYDSEGDAHNWVNSMVYGTDNHSKIGFTVITNQLIHGGAHILDIDRYDCIVNGDTLKQET